MDISLRGCPEDWTQRLGEGVPGCPTSLGHFLGNGMGGVASWIEPETMGGERERAVGGPTQALLGCCFLPVMFSSCSPTQAEG